MCVPGRSFMPFIRVIKAAIVFVRPDWGLASMSRVTLEESRKFTITGVLFIAVALILGYSVWLA